MPSRASLGKSQAVASSRLPSAISSGKIPRPYHLLVNSGDQAQLTKTRESVVLVTRRLQRSPSGLAFDKPSGNGASQAAMLVVESRRHGPIIDVARISQVSIELEGVMVSLTS